VILLVMSVILGSTGSFFSAGLIRLLRPRANMMPAATTYWQVNMIGILFLFGYIFISIVLRALGDTNTPIRFVLLAVLLNIVLDPLFVAGLNWGIQGAALATIAAQGSAFIY